MIEPIRRHITVGADPASAFELFTRGMGSWWPMGTHSMAVEREDGTKVDSLVFEEREGGRVYEMASDGTEGTWATVLEWDPPHRFVLSWKPNRRDEPSTVVEVRFAADGTGTRVDLEHSGWERLGPRAEEASAGYREGWSLILSERYAGSFEQAG